MLIDAEIKDLTAAIEENGSEGAIRRLVTSLTENCALPANRERYREASTQGQLGAFYPVDAQGYAVAYDPLEQEQDFVEAWQRYGFVVGKGIISSAQCAQTISSIKARFKIISRNLCDIDQPETWVNMPRDSAGTPILSRGFLDIYHDDALAQLRQSVRAYIHHVLIWGRTDLWTSFDRVGVKLPHHEESKMLPLHVDQNPLVHPHFKTVQGVLALTDCPAERGTFLAVPGSRDYFAHYASMATNRGEYVELNPTIAISQDLQAHTQVIPLRAGDFVSWDSRTTHANTENVSDDTRIVLYMAAGPARSENAEAVFARKQALQTGEGSNVREALMHASKKPRFTNPKALAQARQPERLNLLGRLLYGIENYATITASPAP